MIDRSRANRWGFSLIEVFIVLSIIGIIVAWSIPSLAPALQSKSLNAVSDKLEQTLNQARQVAMAEDVVVDVEFIAKPTAGRASLHFNGYRFLKWSNSGERLIVENTIWLDRNFIFSEQYSTLLKDGAAETETGQLLENVQESVKIIRFSIYPNGETNLPGRTDDDNWHITVFSDLKNSSLPNNFVCFQINQTNAYITRYRP